MRQKRVHHHYDGVASLSGDQQRQSASAVPQPQPQAQAPLHHLLNDLETSERAMLASQERAQQRLQQALQLLVGAATRRPAQRPAAADGPELKRARVEEGGSPDAGLSDCIKDDEQQQKQQQQQPHQLQAVQGLLELLQGDMQAWTKAHRASCQLQVKQMREQRLLVSKVLQQKQEEVKQLKAQVRLMTQQQQQQQATGLLEHNRARIATHAGEAAGGPPTRPAAAAPAAQGEIARPLTLGRWLNLEALAKWYTTLPPGGALTPQQLRAAERPHDPATMAWRGGGQYRKRWYTYRALIEYIEDRVAALSAASGGAPVALVEAAAALDREWALRAGGAPVGVSKIGEHAVELKKAKNAGGGLAGGRGKNKKKKTAKKKASSEDEVTSDDESVGYVEEPDEEDDGGGESTESDDESGWA